MKKYKKKKKKPLTAAEKARLIIEAVPKWKQEYLYWYGKEHFGYEKSEVEER